MLTDAFDETNLLLNEELDVLMETLKESEKEFYEEYRAARVIKDLGGGRSPKNGKTEAIAPATAESTAA